MPPAKKAKLDDTIQYDATIKTRVYLVVVAKEFAECAAAHSKEIYIAGGRDITAAAAIKMFKEDYPIFAYFEAGKVQSTKFYFLLKTMYKYCLEIAHAGDADVDLLHQRYGEWIEDVMFPDIGIDVLQFEKYKIAL